MSDTRYCYCCRSFHPADQVTLHETKVGKRWRCRRSIAAAKLSTEIRDSFGRQQSAENKAEASRLARESVRMRHAQAVFA